MQIYTYNIVCMLVSVCVFSVYMCVVLSVSVGVCVRLSVCLHICFVFVYLRVFVSAYAV